MKPINLLSLMDAKNDLSPPSLELYLNNFNIEAKKIKEQEWIGIETLINEFKTYSKEIDLFEGFYLGYTINQISKEFDLLRFGEDIVINIELKRENTGDKIIKQLKENKYYLSFLGKEVLNFTYVVKDKTIFYLNSDGAVIETDFLFLISQLNDQRLQKIKDINKLFNPTNYLVSPFNSTDKFIGGHYFLTDHQKNIKNEILGMNSNSDPCFISIQGSAGTGKTLLTYDIAKEYIKDSKKVLIFHCGNLNAGHIQLINNYGWQIAPVKNYGFYNYANYDLIIIDEAQRIYKKQIESIIDKIISTNCKCIFSFDPNQCLASFEIKRNIPQVIKDKASPRNFKLTEKIRTNKEIASFVKNLFDLSQKSSKQVYSNINIQYFSNAREAKKYKNFLIDQGWTAINYTPSKIHHYPYDEYQDSWTNTAHEVIGQEYDNVIAVLDKHFFYNEEGKLHTKGWSVDPYYHPTKMLLQIVTRARKKLSLIIIDNELLLKQCMKILRNYE
ncbi:ATP-binding protein [Bacillus spizizenii]|nr:ATP-binding protein [Bacillus spizizenii]